MAIDTLIPQLVINKMTQSQYDEALESGEIVGTELYFIPSDGSDISGGGGAVASVNGQIGEVNLTAADVGALPNTTVIPDSLDDLTSDPFHRTVTDDQIAAWDESCNNTSNVVIRKW